MGDQRPILRGGVQPTSTVGTWLLTRWDKSLEEAVELPHPGNEVPLARRDLLWYQ